MSRASKFFIKMETTTGNIFYLNSTVRDLSKHDTAYPVTTKSKAPAMPYPDAEAIMTFFTKKMSNNPVSLQTHDQTFKLNSLLMEKR